MPAGLGKSSIRTSASRFSNDGTLVGADISDLTHHFSAYLNAKQSAFKEIVSTLDSGKTVDQAFRPIESVDIPSPKALIRDPFFIYPRLVADELIGLRQRLGDEQVSIIVRKAIRQSEFAIHRSGDIKT